MGFNNPRTPWNELARKLSVLSGNADALAAETRAKRAREEAAAQEEAHERASSERDPEAFHDGAENHRAAHRRIRDEPIMPVSVGEGGSDRRSRYAKNPADEGLTTENTATENTAGESTTGERTATEGRTPVNIGGEGTSPGHAVPAGADGSDAPAFSRPDRYLLRRTPPGAPGSAGTGRAQGAHIDRADSDTCPDRPTPGTSSTVRRPLTTGVPWAELHVHSDFSFLDGASEPEELVTAGAEAGLEALALTDHNGLYGVVRFAQAAARVGLPTVFGSELSVGLTERIPGQVDPEALHVLTLARGVDGYRRLSAAITTANLRGEKNRPVFDLEELAETSRTHGDWWILTGCRKGLLLPHLDDADGGVAALRRIVGMFGRDNVAVELTRSGVPEDDARIRHLEELAARFHLPVVATNAVHYATRSRFRNAQVRAAVRSHRSLDEVAGWLPPTATARIHTGEEMARRFSPKALAGAVRLARDCAFILTAAKAGLPAAPIPAVPTEPAHTAAAHAEPGHTGLTRTAPAEPHDTALITNASTTEPTALDRTTAPLTEAEYLRQKVTERGLERYGTREENPRAWDLLDRELHTIESMGFCGYFLIVFEIAEYCRKNDIFCQGRGSAANSAVCYVLGITAVDAVKYGLLFDRFLSPDREGYPDIDIDIESARRERVIQHVYEHYGRDRAAQVANVITYRAKSAVRDAASALGYEPGQLDAFSKGLHRWSSLPDPEDTHVPAPVLAVAGDLLNTPRHLGIHSGGMILADRPIGEVVPIEPATMQDRTVVQWDKDDCAAMDLVKFDLLGLGMLGALHEMVDLVEKHTGERIDRAALGQDDPKVYDMLCRADAIGIFQVESRAQLATLPRLRPREFYDLAVQVALIRPGPIQGGSVHPYIRRRQGEEPVEYLHPLLEKSLGRTLGVPLFQEQLMQMAIDIAGFSGADADELRRAMGSRRSAERMRQLRERFMRGCAEREVPPEVAEVVFEKIAAFADYGFPESHAISFANLVYDSAWFKRYHHAAFTAGLLRSQPMGFYSPQSLITDARRHGVVILPVDINASQAQADLEPHPDSAGGLAIRIGLASVKHVGKDVAEAIVAARQEAPTASGRPFTSIADVAHRTGVEVSVLEGLAHAGAFESFGLDRRQAMWVAGSLSGAGPDVLPGTSPVMHAPTLPLMDDFDVTLAELFSTGLTVDGYPTEQLREALRARGYASTRDAQRTADGSRITVAGIVTHRQRPATASGITFMNLEDEFGMLNVVCTPGLMKRFAPVSLTRNTLVVTGQLQRSDNGRGDVVSLYAHKLVPLDVQVPTRSRNFR
ncbi:error-prone DNA polymerase [Brevibacterium samyangense]|uniref:Error-prone DNA polymerase n=1 Tax=Brevibacterium samyangense TaxID=366888 RepID=A0ABP5F4U7_9MICO